MGVFKPSSVISCGMYRRSLISWFLNLESWIVECFISGCWNSRGISKQDWKEADIPNAGYSVLFDITLEDGSRDNNLGSIKSRCSYPRVNTLGSVSLGLVTLGSITQGMDPPLRMNMRLLTALKKDSTSFLNQSDTGADSLCLRLHYSSSWVFNHGESFLFWCFITGCWNTCCEISWLLKDPLWNLMAVEYPLWNFIEDQHPLGNSRWTTISEQITIGSSNHSLTLDRLTRNVIVNCLCCCCSDLRLQREYQQTNKMIIAECIKTRDDNLWRWICWWNDPCSWMSWWNDLPCWIGRWNDLPCWIGRWNSL